MEKFVIVLCSLQLAGFRGYVMNPGFDYDYDGGLRGASQFGTREEAERAADKFRGPGGYYAIVMKYEDAVKLDLPPHPRAVR